FFFISTIRIITIYHSIDSRVYKYTKLQLKE
ncbi:LOW QUALITY PROTEIN: hypothetical protein TorRG33x02_297250, partial [Trema orientale]